MDSSEFSVFATPTQCLQKKQKIIFRLILEKVAEK